MTNFPLNLGDVLICLRAWIIPSASAVKMLELSQMRLEKTPKEILLPDYLSCPKAFNVTVDGTYDWPYSDRLG